MTNDIDSLLRERGARYGAFIDHARVTGVLKSVIHSELEHRDVCISPDVREAIDMICHKLGRIACGDPEYDDSWRDIAGYALLVADRINGECR